jgi:hypothetical protein
LSTQPDEVLAKDRYRLGRRVLSLRLNSGQSQSFGSTETNYLAQFGAGPSSLRSDLEAVLAALSTGLSPEDVVARAQALSCAGCHQLSNHALLGNGLV